MSLFFFQAEDGIRDLTVTGVQTCALPICRLKWLSIRPCSRVDWLAVVMRVKNHRALCFGRNQFAEHHRSAPRDRQQMSFNSTCLERPNQMRCVLLNVGSVTGNIGDGKEFAEFAHDAFLIRHAIVANFPRDLCRRWWSRLLRHCRKRYERNT